MSTFRPPGITVSYDAQFLDVRKLEWATIIASVLLAVFLVQQILSWLDKPVLSVPELLWNLLVYLTPASILRRLHTRTPRDSAASQGPTSHAEKSEALREVLRIGSGRVVLKRRPSHPMAPKGLGNWDNSCYQNSILQALSSLPSMEAFYDSLRFTLGELPDESTVSALKSLALKLNDLDDSTSFHWTPSKLKSMSSWQQQDAQEYFSKLVDAMEKDVSDELKKLATDEDASKLSLADSLSRKIKKESNDELSSKLVSAARPPFEGLLAQRVGCTECGYCEGITLVPFNCLTVPLGHDYEYDLSECLNGFTELEYIDGVECAKCSLLGVKSKLEKMAEAFAPQDAAGDAVEDAASAEHLRTIGKRLDAIRAALDSEDFSETNLTDRCQVTKKMRHNSRKSRQAAVVREPKCLVIHINRSVFNEVTGDLLKNYADVNYPRSLNLGPWSVADVSHPNQTPKWDMDPNNTMVPGLPISSGASKGPYELRAVIEHQGRHENGHYICYRQSPPGDEQKDALSEDGTAERWWRLSDERVFPVDPDDITRVGSAFMLFYERRSPEIGSPSASEITELAGQLKAEQPEKSIAFAAAPNTHSEDGIVPEKTSVQEAVSWSSVRAADIPLPASPINLQRSSQPVLV